MTTLAEASLKISKARAELAQFAKTEGATAIGAAFQVFFKKFPAAQRIEWTQYTPHFNDGEPCEFGVHDPDIYAYNSKEHYGDDDTALGEGACKAFDAIWSTCDEDLLKMCFGDGVKVTITEKGVEVEDYDHD